MEEIRKSEAPPSEPLDTVQELRAKLEASERVRKQLEEKLEEFDQRSREIAEKAFAGIITEREVAERAFWNLFKNARIGIFRTTPEGHIIEANDAFIHLLGYTSLKELARVNLETDHYAPEYSREEFKMRIENEGKIMDLESTWTRKDGRTLYVRENARVVFDENGKSLYYEGIVEDLTEGRNAKEKRAESEDRAVWLLTANELLKQQMTERKHAEQELTASYQRLSTTLEGIVLAMGNIVEAKDPYTAGHQERVTKLACGIARELGMSDDQIDGIRISGLLHDVGKIAIPAEILNKPGRLNEMEFKLIKTHPEVGYNILKDVKFPWPIAQMVLQHHERMDGSGYPGGLSAHNILVEARILAVADVVESMSSNRPYRPALGIDKALREIIDNKETLFDSFAVDMCVRLFAERNFEFEDIEKA